MYCQLFEEAYNRIPGDMSRSVLKENNQTLPQLPSYTIQACNEGICLILILSHHYPI